MVYMFPGREHQINTIEELKKSNLNHSIFTHAGGEDCWKIFVANKPEFMVFKDVCTMFKHFLQNPNTAILFSKQMVLYHLRTLGKLKISASYHNFSTHVMRVHKSLNIDC